MKRSPAAAPTRRSPEMRVAVIGAGVTITGSTKIIDVTGPEPVGCCEGELGRRYGHADARLDVLRIANAPVERPAQLRVGAVLRQQLPNFLR